MEKKGRAIKDKRYEDKQQGRKKSQMYGLGNEHTERESRENKRIFEKIRLYKGRANTSGI